MKSSERRYGSFWPRPFWSSMRRKPEMNTIFCTRSIKAFSFIFAFAFVANVHEALADSDEGFIFIDPEIGIPFLEWTVSPEGEVRQASSWFNSTLWLAEDLPCVALRSAFRVFRIRANQSGRFFVRISNEPANFVMWHPSSNFPCVSDADSDALNFEEGEEISYPLFFNSKLLGIERRDVLEVQLWDADGINELQNTVAIDVGNDLTPPTPESVLDLDRGPRSLTFELGADDPRSGVYGWRITTSDGELVDGGGILGIWPIDTPHASSQSITIENLEPETEYTFLARAYDRVGNVSIPMVIGGATTEEESSAPIVWHNSATGESAIWHMQGTRRSLVAFPGGIQNGNWTLAGIGDFDGSGFSDYFWRAPFVGAGQNRIWLLEDDEVSAAGAIPAIGPDWEFFGAGDFNGDGKDDLLWRQTNPLTGQNRVWMMDGLQRTQGSAIPLFPGAEWIPAGIGDLNGDGRDDIVWRSLSRAQTRIWMMDGFGIATSAVLPLMPSFWAVAGVADFDGDGRDDLLWRDEQTGQNRIWLMNGGSIRNRGTINLIRPESWQARGVGDLDADGKADIVWRNAFTGRNRVWLMNGLTRKQGAAIPIESDLNWRIVGVGTTPADDTDPPPPAGDTFKDCPDCPIMVNIPAGTFTQGSPPDEPRSRDDERPQHTVNVPAFALGQTEVTFDEWDACVADGGCSHNPGDQGWGRGDRPVILVSWNDAQEYVAWLSAETGEDYRLPSESEWEYATRAGTTGRFNTGDCITTDQANFKGDRPAQGCPTGIDRDQTLPVASFAPNAFGLYDTHGNVWELVQDCWNTSYNGAPTDGSAWMSGDCINRVRRGGSWVDTGKNVRSADRDRRPRGLPRTDAGFRVARSVGGSSGGGSSSVTGFVRTESRYAYDANPTAACQAEFGAGHQVADWTDVKTYHDSGASMTEFFADTGMTANDRNGAVTRNGEQFYTSNRAYFIARHDGSLPSGWLAHDQIGGHLVSLGSWDTDKKVLCVGSDGSSSGETFKDCPDCPTMVNIPAGTFTQGSPPDEPERESDEGPQRTVNVPAFAMGQTEVTFEQWDACVADGGCSHTPSDSWGRGSQPVIGVSWNDSQEYVTWLSNRTGQDYRLPSESEWEYATRAGTTGRFNTGDCITTDQANFRGTAPAQSCPIGQFRVQTLAVGSLTPNAFGLYNTHGNVQEWVQDCWNSSYDGAPADGSAWMSGDCTSAVIRGGRWDSSGEDLRSAARHSFGRVGRFVDGFRVARQVAP